MSRNLAALCLVIACAGVGCPARADLELVAYNPAVNDRFNGSPDFIGTGYDFSAVGKNVGSVNTFVNGSNGKAWATLITPNFALTSNHLAPAIGTPVTFVGGNAGTAGVTDTVLNSYNIGGSDLQLLRLATPVSTINPVPIIADNPGGLLGQNMFVYGQSNRVGVNNVAGFQTLASNDISTNPGVSVLYVYDPNSSNPNLARVQGGGSGGPSFVTDHGVLSLLGIHWFQFAPSSANDPNQTQGSGDTYVSHYLNDIQAQIAATGSADTVTITPAPEPSQLVLAGLLAGAGVLSLVGRRPAVRNAKAATG